MTAEKPEPIPPPGVDVERPSAARIYDWYLGGTQNWAVDREMGKRLEKMWPHTQAGSRHNREFMNRAVRAALDAGIRQFIDLGSGVPTVGNVHEVVRDHLPEGERATVVYVDYEPVAAAHATVILEREDATDWAELVQADMRVPSAILDDPGTRRLIDFDRPVCLMLMAVLHFVSPEDDPVALVAEYQRRLTPGSWLAMSHMTVPDDPELAAGVLNFAEQYKNTSSPVHLRSKEDITACFGDWELMPPGISYMSDWRPDTEPAERDAHARPYAWCGVAVKH